MDVLQWACNSRSYQYLPAVWFLPHGWIAKPHYWRESHLWTLLALTADQSQSCACQEELPKGWQEFGCRFQNLSIFYLQYLFCFFHWRGIVLVASFRTGSANTGITALWLRKARMKHVLPTWMNTPLQHIYSFLLAQYIFRCTGKSCSHMWFSKLKRISTAWLFNL